MKRPIVFFILFFASLYTFAQYEAVEEQIEDEIIPKTFIGVGNGINNISGMLGFFAETKIIGGISAFGAIGTGGWGYKGSAGLRYYHVYPKKIYYSLFFSAASGLKNYETELDTDTPGGNAEVTLNLYPAYNMNVSLGYQMKFAKRLRFNFELGYSLPLNTDVYEVVTDGVLLSKESEAVLDLQTPGGIILGFGFSIGF